jgi:ankyrin repeat protein
MESGMPTREELNRFNARAQALGEAAARGDVKRVSLMLAEEPALVTHTRPFSDACKAGQPEAVLALIRAGAPVNTTDGSGPGFSRKPLLWALRPSEWTDGHLRVVEVLLDHGADPSGGPDEEVVTPLLAAAEWNHPAAIALLVERGARVGFYEAVALGDVTTVKSLLARSPELAWKVRRRCVGFSGDPGTSLHFAGFSRLGKDDSAVASSLATIAKLLIAHGAPPNTATIEGVTIAGPIANAARSGNVAVARVLLAHGADPQEALVPALTGSEQAILGLIADAQLDLDLVGDPKLDNSILQDLIRYGQLSSAEWLIARGVGVDRTDRNGWTALHYACSRGVSPEFVQLLLRRGANPAAPDASGATPLDLARARGRGRLVELLERRALA